MQSCKSVLSLDPAIHRFEAAVRRAHAAAPLTGPEVERSEGHLRATLASDAIRAGTDYGSVRARYDVDVVDPFADNPTLRRATDVFVEHLTAKAVERDLPDARRHKALIDLVRRTSELRLGDGCYASDRDSYQTEAADEIVEAFYQRGVMGEWYRDTVARVHALESLYRPFGRLANEARTPIDPIASTIFRYSADGRAIRSRGAIAEYLITRAAMVEESSRFRVVSLACGAARPVLRAAHEANHAGRPVEIALYDVDPDALAFARLVAADLGDTAQSMETGHIDLTRPESFEEIEAADVVEALGIVEYFPGRVAAAFLQQAMDRVKPGGQLLFGNMLSGHPQLTFNRKVVSWPGLFPRAITEMTRLAERCGVVPEQIEAYVPNDGVYAVYVWHKPA